MVVIFYEALIYFRLLQEVCVYVQSVFPLVNHENCSKHFAKRWYAPEFSVKIVKHVLTDCQSE